MASGFVYTDAGAVFFDDAKFVLLDDLLTENQHANTIIVYQYKEELAELKRRFNVATLEDNASIDKWNRGETPLLAIHPASAGQRPHQ